jgi:D-tyrosyl-tRNA(Tyr) deacylase
LVGVERGDGPEQLAAAVEKLSHLRLFGDDEGRMNLDSAAAGGAFLVVSQFTLAASLDRGRRPSFDGGAAPGLARHLVDELIAGLRGKGFEVAQGRFGASMEVELVNEGPATFVLDLAPHLAGAISSEPESS